MCQLVSLNSMYDIDDYLLSGIIYHSGSAESGHYKCAIRCMDSDVWLNFNDNTFNEIRKENLRLNSNDICMVIYSRIAKAYNIKSHLNDNVDVKVACVTPLKLNNKLNEVSSVDPVIAVCGEKDKEKAKVSFGSVVTPDKRVISLVPVNEKLSNDNNQTNVIAITPVLKRSRSTRKGKVIEI